MADTKPDPKKVLEFVKENNVQMLDLRFTDLPGLWHHVSYPIAQLSEVVVRRGLRHGRLVHPRLGSHSRERHAADSRRHHVHARSLHRSSDAGDGVRCDRSGHQAALRSRSALHRQEGRDVSGLDRHWPTPPTSAPKPSSSSSTTCASIRTSTKASTSSTPKRAAGTPDG